MTPRNLFSIILKIFGLYLIRDLFRSVPNLLTVFIYFKAEDNFLTIITLISESLTVLIEIAVCYPLIFNSDWIIDKLKFTAGFDRKDIPLNMHLSSILSIAVIVIGGLILTDEIPNLCHLIYLYFEEKSVNYSRYNTETSYIVLSIVKIILAILILTENRRIVSFILRKKNPGTAE